MLTLESIIESILIKDHWQTFDLPMTPFGFIRLGDQLKNLNQKSPQVYIHVCDEGVLRNKVLRIGKAEDGVYQRWIKSTNGHCSTFLWAIGESERYGHNNAIRYPDYLLFFASLHGLKTKLYVLTCQNGAKGKGAARASEAALIAHCSPMWDGIRKKYKNFVDQDNHESITALGGALSVFRKQQSDEKVFSELIPKLNELGTDIGGIFEGF